MKSHPPIARPPHSGLKRLLMFVLSAYITVVIALVTLETQMLFPAPSLNRGNWNSSRFNASENWVPSRDDTEVHVWTIKHDYPRATIVFSHGNGEDLGSLGSELLELNRRLSVNVVAYDFRGYGKTGGKPNQRNILADAASVGIWVNENPDLNTVPIIPMGRSLGGAAAIEMATTIQSPGLVLDRTFSSAVDVAASFYPFVPVRLLMKNRFGSEQKIKQYSGRLLQAHGNVDNVIPIGFGKKLFDACPSSQKEFLEIPNLGHNDPHSDAFWNAISELIQDLEP